MICAKRSPIIAVASELWWYAVSKNTLFRFTGFLYRDPPVGRKRLRRAPIRSTAVRFDRYRRRGALFLRGGVLLPTTSARLPRKPRYPPPCWSDHPNGRVYPLFPPLSHACDGASSTRGDPPRHDGGNGRDSHGFTGGQTAHAGYQGILTVVTAHLFVLVYPGLFLWYAARLVKFSHNSELILLFMLAVYLNDSLAWFFGRLLGPLFAHRHPTPVVAISPNKSLAGFIGGFLASVATIVTAGRIAPEILPGSLVAHLIFGALIGLAAIVGDLIESGLKRSAAIKDSGQLIPGRGGYSIRLTLPSSWHHSFTMGARSSTRSLRRVIC